MTYLVIGAGAMGINICAELLKNDKKVVLMTKSIKSVSADYGIGILDKKISILQLNLPFYSLKKINLIWFILFLINNYANYYKNKKMLFQRSFKLLKHYEIIPKKCKETYLLNGLECITKLLNIIQTNDNCKLINRTVDLNNIDNLSTKYEKVFICIGSHSRKSIYNQNIGGYKITLKAAILPKCLVYYKGLFITSRDGNLEVRGGVLLGDSKKDKIDNRLIEIKLKKMSLWTKFKCSKIIKTIKGARSTSIDLLPYYYSNKNVIHIKGGSLAGYILAPALANSLVNTILNRRNTIEFDFSINRLYYKTIRSIIFVLVIILLIMLI